MHCIIFIKHQWKNQSINSYPIDNICFLTIFALQLSIMQRYFIALSYQGTHFHGWQLQENAYTVQEEIEYCLTLIMKENIRITGCGRTDTGVHARFYVAHFDIRKSYSQDELEKFIRKVNMFLPDSVVIHQIVNVHEENHARFSALERTYKYFISRKKNPFVKDYSYEYQSELNLRLMQLSCNVIRQYEDFTSFSKSGGNSKTNQCKIISASWTEYPKEGMLVFSITADRFLRNMVRAIVGTMLDIGKEKSTLEDLRKILTARKRSAAGASVDACGLFLWDVKYEHVIFSKPAVFIYTDE
jgi:tRNA pseudouridine38-40 synthase